MLNGAKVYISGRMTGVKDFEEIFQIAEERIIQLGGEPVNPVKIEHNQSIYENVAKLVGEEEANWPAYIIRDLVYLLACDYIFLLPGWTRSFGAKIEFFFAVKMGLQVMCCDDRETEQFANAVGLSYNRRDDELENWFRNQFP